jgi:c-di-GMP-binding flagellar brake protein YcgR
MMDPFPEILDRLPEWPETTERRQFQRIMVMLPVEFIASHPDTGRQIKGEGILRDFSLCGAFILVSKRPPLKIGHQLALSIALPLSPINEFDPSHIQAYGKVVRLEEPAEDQDCFGLAISFDHFPTFYPFVIEPDFPF